jgi:hypothetical protein
MEFIQSGDMVEGIAAANFFSVEARTRQGRRDSWYFS